MTIRRQSSWAAIAILLALNVVFAADSAAPATAPATKPTITTEAQAELDQVRDAYKGLKSLKLEGTLSADLQVLGQNQTRQAQFNSSFQAPNQFRHEIKDEVLTGSTGEKAYVFIEQDKQFAQADAPKQRSAVSEWPRFVVSILQAQNPSLLLAMAKDPAAELVEGATDVQRLPDTKLGDQTYQVLLISQPLGEHRFLLDPKTHLIRQAHVDLRRLFEQRGVDPDQIKNAELTFDYKDVALDGPVQADQFAWTPPAGARDASALLAASRGGPEEGAAMDLVGKPAPDFTLTDLAGKTVKLSELKDSVVVLDFWATWCPPCVRGLPLLDKVYKAKSAQGLKAFAIDLKEPKDTVQTFIDQKKLTIPVLLDESGEVANQYKAEAIPQTVLIGKDGVVKKVLIGLHTEEQLNQEIDQVMGK